MNIYIPYYDRWLHLFACKSWNKRFVSMSLFSSLVQQPKLCLNELRTTRSCQATKRRMPSQRVKTERSKNSCGHCPLWIVRPGAVTKMPCLGVFFHGLRWWRSSRHTLGKLNLTKVTHHHFDSCVLNCSGSFSTSSPERPVQSSLLACEYRVKRRTWVQWVTFDWLKAQQIVCFWLLYVFLCLFEVIFCFLP